MYRVHLTEAQRAELHRRTRDPQLLPRTRDRLEMVRLADAGFSVPEIARLLPWHEATVRAWIKRFLAEGFDGLPDQPHVGQTSQLTPELLDALRQELARTERTSTAGQLADWLLIPLKAFGDSGRSRSVIPAQTVRSFRRKPSTAKSA